MTQTYAQLQKQIEKLQREADALLAKEVQGVISRIKEAIAHYGLTAEQLGFVLPARPPHNDEKAPPARSRAGKYADGSGRSWSGRGKRPSWLRDALAAGKKLEDFLVAGAAADRPAKAAKAPGARRVAPKVMYRDGAGNSWTGRGPTPRWLKAALDSGRSLEELRE